MTDNKNLVKVLHAHASLRSGGVAVLLYNYYTKMDHEKIRFDHIINTPDNGMIGKKFEDEGSFVYHLPRFNHLFSTFWGTRKIIKEGQYKIVHVHHTQKSFIQLFAAWTCGVPVRIAHSHNYYTNEKKHVKLANAFFSFLTRIFATDYFSCSDLAGEYVYGNAIHGKKYKKIINAIDIPMYIYDETKRNKLRTEYGVNDEFVICHVGRMTRQKNPFRLVDIFECVTKQKKDTKLLWIGAGELETSIKDYVNEKGLSGKVIFLGETDRVYDYLQMADLFFLPSLYEGLGIVLIEAQASGLPCVASDVIPGEVKLTPQFSFLSLSESDEKWANTILAYEFSDRKDYSKEIKNAGYSLSDKAVELQEWYCSKI